MKILQKIVFLAVAAAFVALPYCSAGVRHYAPGLAVVCGIVFAVAWGNPFARYTARLTSHLLAVAIVLMGFGMDLGEVLQAGAHGLIYTFTGIVLGLGLGVWLGKKLGLERDCTWLVSVGTAICGGSAIAAAAPALNAKAHSIAIASATVFTLNAAALLIFPVIGHQLNFTQEQFGFWSALAIHDTSSVVGATMQYGKEALEIGTTVKLARALWIIPVTLFISLFVVRHRTHHEPDGHTAAPKRFKIKVPWFIPGFLTAAAIVSFLPALAGPGNGLKELSKYLMILTLFLIGANLSREKLRELGLKPVIMGVGLWLLLSTLWCALIYFRIVNCVR